MHNVVFYSFKINSTNRVGSRTQSKQHNKVIIWLRWDSSLNPWQMSSRPPAPPPSTISMINYCSKNSNLKLIKLQQASGTVEPLVPPWRECRVHLCVASSVCLLSHCRWLHNSLPSPSASPSSAAEEPDITRAQSTLSVYRGEPSHTTHSDGNFHLHSCPSGTAWTEYLWWQPKGDSSPSHFHHFWPF